MLTKPVHSHVFYVILAAVSLTLSLNAKQRSPGAATQANAEPQRTAVLQNYGKLPMSFEVNEGQTDSKVRFLTRSQSFQLFLEASRVTMRLSIPTEPAYRQDRHKQANASDPQRHSFKNAKRL